jgi:hypothetical protein
VGNGRPLDERAGWNVAFWNRVRFLAAWHNHRDRLSGSGASVDRAAQAVDIVEW